MRAFEVYLAATFLLGCLQLRNQARVFQLVVRAPGRWPHLVQLVRKNLGQLLTLSTVVTVGVGGGLWVAHALARHVFWPEAAVFVPDLEGRPALLATAIVTGLAMVALDAWAIVRTARFRPPRQVWLLDWTEAGLSGASPSPVRALLGWHVRRTLRGNLPVVRRWVWRRTAEQTARLLFGLTLWVAWRPFV